MTQNQPFVGPDLDRHSDDLSTIATILAHGYIRLQAQRSGEAKEPVEKPKLSDNPTLFPLAKVRHRSNDLNSDCGATDLFGRSCHA